MSATGDEDPTRPDNSNDTNPRKERISHKIITGGGSSASSSAELVEQVDSAVADPPPAVGNALAPPGNKTNNGSSRSCSVDRLVGILVKESPKLDRLCQELLHSHVGSSTSQQDLEDEDERKPAANHTKSVVSTPPSLATQIVSSTIEAILQSEEIMSLLIEMEAASPFTTRRLNRQKQSADANKPKSRIKLKTTTTNGKCEPLPIKSVSFSSISAPLLPSDDEEEEEEERVAVIAADNDLHSTDDEIAHFLPSTHTSVRPARPAIRTTTQERHQALSSTTTLFSIDGSRRVVRSASPSIRYNYIRHQQQQPSSSPTPDSAGETTASGDSSVVSVQISNRTAGSTSAIAAATSQVSTGPAAPFSPAVHFSAINPNPQLVLGSAYSQHESYSHHVPIVRFTADRSISWEDEQLVAGAGGSRASRSGLSSPSIEPALSPPRSISRSPLQIHFNDLAIETITEAAARLRINERSVGPPRVVHFSAMKDVTVVAHREDAAAALFTPTTSASPSLLSSDNPHNNTYNAHPSNNSTDNSTDVYIDATAIHDLAQQQQSRSLAAKMRFRPISTSNGISNPAILRHHHEAEISDVADRFRRLIRRAEQVDNNTLEAAFEHFDQYHSGTITPLDLQRGLQSLGETFNFSLEECSALLACLSGSSSTEARGINLLGFYRAVGRRSPPPERNISNNNEDDDGQQQRMVSMLLTSSPIFHAHDAANRLRDIVLEAEQNDGIPLESSFRLFDPTESGYISAIDFSMGLQELGQRRRNDDTNAFALINDEDCEELVALFDTNNDGLVSLLEFYRFMGRRSPPPLFANTSSYDSDDDARDSNDPA